MTLELKEGGYAKLKQGIREIERLARDSLDASQNMKDLAMGNLRVIHEIGKLGQMLEDTVLMVPDAPSAGNGEKGAAA